MQRIKPLHFVTDDRRGLLAADGDKVAYCVVISPGKYAGAHLHKEKTERVYVVSGPVRFITEDEGERMSVMLDEGDGVLIPPLTPHKFEASDYDVILLVLADRAGEDDTAAVIM